MELIPPVQKDCQHELELLVGLDVGNQEEPCLE